MRRANRTLELLAEWFALVGGLVVVVLMAMIALDALGRKTFGALPGAHEFSEALMVPAVFLPLMFVQLKREHVFVSVVTAAMPVRAQAFLDGIAAIVGALIFIFLTWLAVVKALDAFAVREYRVAIIAVPIWPFRWIIPLGTGLLVFQLVLTAMEELSRAFGRAEPAPEVEPVPHL
ncbi:MAG TPA: TRAP transporter small permease [Xanthobacteraceae bacterium]|nr:TRAP transporter small permease [Xanthobacteraceae bacterium]